MASASNNPLGNQVLEQLQKTKSLVPTRAWLETFLATQRPGLPLVAVVKTASFRLLHSDIKTCLDTSRSPVLPSNVVNATVKETRVAGPVVVQVLDIEDMSRSRWSQIEELEAEERGEMTKGREIIRIAPPEEGEQGGTTGVSGLHASNGPHKLLLEDARGTRVYAIELRKVDGINLNMGIGSKLVLKDLTVARGVVLLEPNPQVGVLGGKLDPLHTHWCAARKDQLRAIVQSVATTVTSS